MKPLHILIVDDEPAIVNLTARVFETHDVTVARDGLEALMLASGMAACDLLITDYLMPSMAGDELAGRLRQRWPALRTLLMTGYANAIVPDRATVDACLPKPLTPSALRKAVRDLLVTRSAVMPEAPL